MKKYGAAPRRRAVRKYFVTVPRLYKVRTGNEMPKAARLSAAAFAFGGYFLMRHIEDTEQITLVRWAELQTCKYPELEMLFHIPNGGKRDAREAARFKQMGVKAGVPDLFLAAPRGRFHGLFIEMKSPNGKVTEHQRKWLGELAKRGYDTAVCHSFEEARNKITEYILREK